MINIVATTLIIKIIKPPHTHKGPDHLFFMVQVKEIEIAVDNGEFKHASDPVLSKYDYQAIGSVYPNRIINNISKAQIPARRSIANFQSFIIKLQTPSNHFLCF